MKKILVLCTGNSCRSIMAEALINRLCGNCYVALSAGSKPTGSIHPKAIATLDRYQINAGQPRSKSWDDFADQTFSIVITVCAQAENETCPMFLGNYQKLHWDIPDPAKIVGSDAVIDEAFENTFKLLKQRIEAELM